MAPQPGYSDEVERRRIIRIVGIKSKPSSPQPSMENDAGSGMGWLLPV
jgi:hypothetical protein